MRRLEHINENAHLSTFHPGALRWPVTLDEEERLFYSRYCFEREDNAFDAGLYIAKELAQLSEIEKHVSVVLGLVLAEMQALDGELVAGFSLHQAMSNFAAEELHHADMFYRYVRLVLGEDMRLRENMMSERLALYQQQDSPMLKLAALVASAYVGESVITIFEHRLRKLDPGRVHFLSQLIWAHGLDESRHIQFDHFAFDEVFPRLSGDEKRRFFEILLKQLELNHQLGQRFEARIKARYQRDYTRDNMACDIQGRLTQALGRSIFAGGRITRADDALGAEEKRLLREFAGVERIHP